MRDNRNHSEFVEAFTLNLIKLGENNDRVLSDSREVPSFGHGLHDSNQGSKHQASN